MRRTLALFLVCLGMAAGLAAQDVQAWFDRSADSAAYASVQADFTALAATEIAGMGSDKPLADRLSEGARKGVAPTRLLAALRTETDRLLEAAVVIKRRGLLPAKPTAAGDLMAQIGIALRAGLDTRDVEVAFDGAMARLGAIPAAADRAVLVLSAVAGLAIDDVNRAALIGALSSSALPPYRLHDVRGAFAELLARNYGVGEATRALIASYRGEDGSNREPAGRAGDGAGPPDARTSPTHPSGGDSDKGGRGDAGHSGDAGQSGDD